MLNMAGQWVRLAAEVNEKRGAPHATIRLAHQEQLRVNLAVELPDGPGDHLVRPSS